MGDKVQRGKHEKQGQAFNIICPKAEVAPTSSDDYLVKSSKMVPRSGSDLRQRTAAAY